jgi:hypothetical protein
MVQEEEGLAEHIHEDPRLAKIQAVREKVCPRGHHPIIASEKHHWTCTYVKVVGSFIGQMSCQCRPLSGIMPKPNVRWGAVFWVHASVLPPVGTITSLDSSNRTTWCL